MNQELQDYIQRVDPDIYESLNEMENFEEIVEAIKADADEINEKLVADGYWNSEQVAYLFGMQNRALNQVIEEIEELRPAIRFITSVLLGNTETEEEGDA